MPRGSRSGAEANEFHGRVERIEVWRRRSIGARDENLMSALGEPFAHLTNVFPCAGEVRRVIDAEYQDTQSRASPFLP